MPTFPYLIINAFTRSSLGGNPAAVILLPPGSLSLTNPTPLFDNPKMIALAKSFAQPITVFFSPPSPNEDDGVLDIRFFAGDHIPLICGHGMFATTKAVCSGFFPGLSGVGEDGVVKYRTAAGTIISAKAVPRIDQNIEEDFYALELPVTAIKEVTGADKDRVHNAVAKALRKDPSQLGINFVARGDDGMESYLMVVLDGKEELEGRDVDTNALLDARPFGTISLSHPTPDKDHAFVSRVFAPACGIPEDHVCGSAHTLIIPYYALLPQSRLKSGQDTYIRQVSPRGGDLWVSLDDQRGVIILKGNAKLFAKGELML